MLAKFSFGYCKVSRYWTAKTITHTYSVAGNLLETRLPDGVLSAYRYDNAGQLLELSHTGNSAMLSAFRYEYDPVGNRAVVTETLHIPYTKHLPPVLRGNVGGSGGYPPPESLGLEGVPFLDKADPYPDGAYPYPASEDDNGTVSFWQRVLDFFSGLLARVFPVTPAHAAEAQLNLTLLPAASQASGDVLPFTVIRYQYDPLNRLTEANYSDGMYYHYSHDAAGNRLTEATPAGTASYVYDEANRLTHAGVLTYTWDANGNLLSDGVKTYTYSHANRLTGISGPGETASFAYSGLGDRVRQTVNGVTTNYALDINSNLTQVLADGTATYLYGLGRISQYKPTQTEYFLTDALGSLRQLVDASGNATLAKAYQPYGEVSRQTGSGNSSYGFAGEWWDGSGLVYLRARYYAPGQGRFISRDVWEGDYEQPMSYNRWLYVSANPANYIDPSGMCVDEDGDGRCDCGSELPDSCSQPGTMHSVKTYPVPRMKIPDSVLDRIKLIVWRESSEGKHPSWAWEWYAWPMMNRYALNNDPIINYRAAIQTGGVAGLLKNQGLGTDCSDKDKGHDRMLPYQPCYEQAMAALRDPMIQTTEKIDLFEEVSKSVDETHNQFRSGMPDPTYGATYFSHVAKTNKKRNFPSITAARCYFEEKSAVMEERFGPQVGDAQLFPFTYAISPIFYSGTTEGKRIFIFASNHSVGYHWDFYPSPD